MIMLSYTYVLELCMPKYLDCMNLPAGTLMPDDTNEILNYKAIVDLPVNLSDMETFHDPSCQDAFWVVYFRHY